MADVHIGERMRRSRRRVIAAFSALVCGALALFLLGSGEGSESAASSAVVFEEASAALGVAEPRSIDGWGIAVTDWNRDGCDDLYVGRHIKDDPRLYRNGCPGRFTDEAVPLLHLRVPHQNWDRHPAAFGHMDADGRPDLFITTGCPGERPHTNNNDQLYHQLQGGDFEDLAPTLGVTDVLGCGRIGFWFDAEGDGDLDLFVGHRAKRREPETSKNLLWRNDGGSFTNAAAQAGLGNFEWSNSGVASDLDGDGDLDLVTAPGRGGSVYLNRGDGTFAFASLRLTQALSAAPGDYDNDGDVDLFVSRTEQTGRTFISVLLRNDGPGSWTDVTASSGTGYSHAGSAVWIDVNSDGWLDLFIVREVTDTGVKQPNVLLLNQHDGTFVDVAVSAGVSGPTDTIDTVRNSGAWGDFDRDGRVDLVVLTARKSLRPVQLYLNRTSGGNHWITLHLNQANGNPDAIGAKLWVTAGAITQYRELTSGTADKSQSPPYFMIGLGSSNSISELRIRWPDGTAATFTNVAADRHYALDKGGGLKDIS